ncbi:MAG: hypothetical protein PWP28_1535 [Oceanotoga sp.]|jgi:AcrR family transcriptional regulator|uniref:TetR family transcriptional regulator n=1 Tax=Oceanotoga teriensis TaxID=515440 RepID=A0AA45C6H7_9BACT|nr:MULTISPECIES: TetR/AcrR family transcriptional regulator [Oceanotoga]MDN5342660.1 hypothetical protein [Oceanotoga sp.]PWJ92021.1 TetR family transcriptional regulator [Oceanotoga teriensis]
MDFKEFKNKERLMSSAIKEFGDKNFQNASLNNILKNAQISKGTFYYNFKTKEELYFYLIEKIAQEKSQYFENYYNENKIDYSDIFSVFEIPAKIGLRFASEYPEYIKFGQNVVNEKDPRINQKIQKKLSSATNQFIKPIIKASIEKNIIRSDIPEDFINELMSFMISNYYKIIEENIDFNDKNYYEKAIKKFNYLIDILKNGLLKK